MFLYGEEIDSRLNWPLGKSERLARRQKIPHVVLPDGSLRFEWDKIEPLLKFMPTVPDEGPCTDK